MKTDVNRDKLWKVMELTGWQPVRLIALDEMWSAMRFKAVEKYHLGGVDVQDSIA